MAKKIGGEADVRLQLRPGRFDCVEVYLPKRIRYLSKLYKYLIKRLKDKDKVGGLPIEGFTIYEGDGAWRDEQEQKIWDERTLIVRILFAPPKGSKEQDLNYKIMALGRDIGNKVGTGEKQIMICHYEQSVTVFTPKPTPEQEET